MFSVISAVFNQKHFYNIFEENKKKNTLQKTIKLLLKSYNKRCDYNNWDFSVYYFLNTYQKQNKKFLIQQKKKKFV